jgi:hypothetical protein
MRGFRPFNLRPASPCARRRPSGFPPCLPFLEDDIPPIYRYAQTSSIHFRRKERVTA